MQRIYKHLWAGGSDTIYFASSRYNLLISKIDEAIIRGNLQFSIMIDPAVSFVVNIFGESKAGREDKKQRKQRQYRFPN